MSKAIPHRDGPEPGAAGEACEAPPALDLVALEVGFFEALLDTPTLKDLPPNMYEAEVLADLEFLRVQARQAVLLPRLPMVLPELVVALRDPDVSTGHLKRVISRDPMVVSAVLRVANSAYFRRRRHVTDVREAIVVLGHDGLRRLLPSLAMQPVFTASSGSTHSTVSGPRTWAYAQRCGQAALALAGEHGEAFSLYLSGMALGAGLLIVVRAMDRRRLLHEALVSAPFARRAMAIGRKLAGGVAEQWALPEATLKLLGDYNADRRTAAAAQLAMAEALAMSRTLLETRGGADPLPGLVAAFPQQPAGRVHAAWDELRRFEASLKDA
ncbi:HDOD domain-containing protein [Oleiagrimonas sp. C23AA]|uniref:HDOD domain-containing protein n=1 Tax=Oleiagrimonas sp. C23AA TaxID=2719047 RepID=UPI00141FC697|nr:HDOD domain-containing protein [Oleiagrimonas sp. C23AA]NII09607.1 HDOD domain-containing protein [Oleiagrimonas sp. C23AA]